VVMVGRGIRNRAHKTRLRHVEVGVLGRQNGVGGANNGADFGHDAMLVVTREDDSRQS